MKIFHCGRCDQLVFFESTACVNCGHALAYVPDRADVIALAPDADHGRAFRLCRNYAEEHACNWALPADDPGPYCRSCRLTRTRPDLNPRENRVAWKRLEAAKRRLVYSLIALGLPLATRAEDPVGGLAFDFLADPEPGQPGGPVLTGHDEGIITINIAEADHAERERRRLRLHEPYRTILGHFRHEVGHYYWDRLIRDTARIGDFRRAFGDERPDYDEALRRHYKEGVPKNWRKSFISAYATMHPWEDWAETWAHYLHMTDTLETAVACGLSLQPRRPDEPAMDPDLEVIGQRPRSFDQVIARWFPLTYVLNNLNRGMGHQDAYPFVLSSPAIEKLRFVHEVICGAD